MYSILKYLLFCLFLILIKQSNSQVLLKKRPFNVYGISYKIPEVIPFEFNYQRFGNRKLSYQLKLSMGQYEFNSLGKLVPTNTKYQFFNNPGNISYGIKGTNILFKPGIIVYEKFPFYKRIKLNVAFNYTSSFCFETLHRKITNDPVYGTISEKFNETKYYHGLSLEIFYLHELTSFMALRSSMELVHRINEINSFKSEIESSKFITNGIIPGFGGNKTNLCFSVGLIFN